jgi:hypothetical protein
MIIRKTPSDVSKYIIVTSDTSIVLHKNGFVPKYMSLDGEFYYYDKTYDILSFIKSNNLIALD